MDIRQLKYFITVVEEGTVTGAARKLNMTQPPLTAQLHSLEEELGCSLFSHKSRRLQLTEAGRLFYKRACTIIGTCDAAINEMNHFRRGITGTLRIGAVSSVEQTLFVGWIGEFARSHQLIQFELYSANTYQLLEQLRLGQLDLAFVRTPFSASSVDILPIAKETMTVVGKKEFFSENEIEKGLLSLSELAAKPLILYRRWHNVLTARFESAGCTPKIRCFNDSAETTLALANEGIGVGILPASGIHHPLAPGTVLCSIDDSALHTEISLICRSRKNLSKVAEDFWEMMAKLCGSESGLP